MKYTAHCEECNGKDNFVGEMYTFIDETLRVKVAEGPLVVEACSHHMVSADGSLQHNLFRIEDELKKPVGVLMVSSVPGPQIFNSIQ